MSDDQQREALAEVLYEWNTPDDPFFVIRGRAWQTATEDPYLYIADAVLSSDWLAQVKREAAADAFEEAATELDRVLTIGTTPWGDLPARDIGWYARHPMGGEPLVAPRDWLRARATSIRSGGTS